MRELSESQKLKYWLDIEFTMINIKFLIVVYLLTTNFYVHWFLLFYGFVNVVYMLPRLGILAEVDKDFLKVPPRL